jgi:hypothetical protein
VQLPGDYKDDLEALEALIAALPDSPGPGYDTAKEAVINRATKIYAAFKGYVLGPSGA